MDDHRAHQQQSRAAAMRLFSLAPWDIFDAETKAASSTPHTILRGPEAGLMMLRGRMGSTGSPFNFGEATVTRCTVKLGDGTEGHAYVIGRNADHARRAALFDALFQKEPERVLPILSALQIYLQAQEQKQASQAAATKVEFFTMVRGDD